MKFSPIMIFVFILLVLAISIIFGDVLKELVSSTPSSSQRLEEGFLSYNYDAQSAFKDNIKIEYYSPTKPVHRLYDNLYYDPVNGSVIVLFGGQYEGPKPDPTAKPEYKMQYYKMSPLELKWYRKNNTDFNLNNMPDDAALQRHWESNGYKEPENQGRNNQPPLTTLELEWYKKNNGLSGKTDDELYDHWLTIGKPAKLSRVAQLTPLELKWYKTHASNSDLSKMSDADLQKHWWQIGYDEKRNKDPPDYVKNISGYTVFNRDGTSPGTYTPTIEVDTFEHAQSKVTDLKSSYTNIYIIAENDKDKYELVYIPWGKETYLHVIQLKSNGKYSPKHLRTYAYDATGKIVLANGTTGINYDSTAAVIQQVYSQNKNTKDNNTYKTIDKYSTKHYLFQVCTNLYYNYSNGELVSQPSDSEIRVYSRPTSQTVGGSLASANHVITPGSSITLSTDVAEVSGFSAGVTEVLPNNAYTLLYISTGRRTILVALEATNPTNDNNEFAVRNVVLFDAFKKRDAGPNVTISDSNFGNTPPSVTPKGDDITMYYQFLLGMMGTSDANISKLPITNDYMLKTQIVPPVCPTCPSCSVAHSGVCTNCGGQGGSGTQTKASDKKEGEDKDDEGKEVVDLLKSTGSGATSLVRDAGSGATSLVRDTASGTVGLAKDTASGTVGLAKETVGGAVGLAKETVGGAVGLAKEAGSGIANTFGKLNPTVVSSSGQVAQGQTSGQTQGQSAGNGAGVNITAGSDPTSYFGALPAKGGDFIPVTADFSRFGR